MEREQFVSMLQAEGFSNMVNVTREPNGAMESHTHPFEAKALILDGEIRIRTGGIERIYCAGDVFHLRAEEPHFESYGPQGVRYLVGRK
ncbi:cupin domain-containing protein [Oxalobacteraceae bacterium OM1]|nr:cupin domain-containing protein [Oxalobacteraceae bacterium OM1]